MPIDPGTLAGYDQLLSISQEAVNRQLKTLYLTEVDPPIPNGPTHLINHEMHFHAKRATTSGKMITSRDGLDGYVCCPQIEFGGETISDKADKYRMAVIKFKFRKAEDWEIEDDDEAKGKRADSVLIYKQVADQDENGNNLYEYPEVIINGWEISWVAQIDRQDIQDVFEDIIKPAESTESKVSISEGLKEGLKSVNSSNFQVATIFCAMQSARLLRSFALVDGNGNVPTNLKNTKGQPVVNKNLVEELKNMLVAKFTPASGDNNSVKGPTPDNPFILGYTVSQKKATMEQVNPAAAAAKIPTPAYFIPKTFRCNLSPKSVYSGGTLNYCMLTHRANNPPNFDSRGRDRYVDDGVDGAGRFPENVFARVKSKAEPGSVEGALFFCQDIFVNYWIGSSVAPLFYTSPGNIAPKIAQLIEDKYNQVNIKGAMTFNSDFRDPTRELKRGNEYKMTNSFRSGRKIIAQNGIQDPTESMKLEYKPEPPRLSDDTAVIISYENLNPLRDDDDDMKRRLLFTIGSYTTVKIRIYRRLAVSHVGDWFEGIFTGSADKTSDDNWEDAIETTIYLYYKHTFEIGTSPQNAGSFTVENPKSHHLDNNGNLLAYNGVPNGYQPGLWKNTETHGWVNTFKFAFDNELSGMTSVGEETGKSAAATFQGALDDLVKYLGTTVILPAGDVFMFKGMSADSENNVFTTISYNTPIGGDVKTQEAKDISLSR